MDNCTKNIFYECDDSLNNRGILIFSFSMFIILISVIMVCFFLLAKPAWTNKELEDRLRDNPNI